tara:strand:- start:4847 stop:5005 length:159 start_codon:yes stop_codon:yes gene_type:complete
MNPQQKILDFCAIQLEIIKQRESNLRKEILDCKIQTEFLVDLIEEIKKGVEK